MADQEICASAAEIAARVREGRSSALAEAEAALARIDAREDEVRAWQYLDPARVRAEAAARDEGGAAGPLAGVPVGIKDIIDTADQPTENGVATDVGRQPDADAIVLTRLREAGAVILGKTVTTECAYFPPGKTRNPHDTGRTPGGSSSGSGAAVGGGMIPLALGSQTVGSVLRPAAFCGAWGMKPTYGTIPRTGVLLISHTLDHVGVFGRSPADLALAIDAMSGDDGIDPASAGKPATRLAATLEAPLAAPRLALVKDYAWPEIEPHGADLIEGAAKQLGAEERPLPDVLDGIFPVQQAVMATEMAHYLGARYDGGKEKLSERLRSWIEEGRAVSATHYLGALDQLAAMRIAAGTLLSDVDAAITAVAPGEAPEGHAATGNPKFCLMWTALGVPAVTVPAFKGPAGMPIGLQVIGARGNDAGVLRAAAWIAQELGASPA